MENIYVWWLFKSEFRDNKIKVNKINRDINSKRFKVKPIIFNIKVR